MGEDTAVLDRLIVAYERGLLVPFLGAGMSAGVCRLWSSFVVELERRARLRPRVGDAEPTHRAARAVRRLRLGSGEHLGDAVAASVLCGDGPGPPPEQTGELARIFWPHVVTTNYDDLYLAAAHEEHLRSSGRVTQAERTEAPLLILGRSAEDCRRLLASLRQPDLPILWAVQGFVGGQAHVRLSRAGGSAVLYCDYATLGEPHRLARLRAELVVGHAEYRRVAMASEPFRRAFAELFRSRSLLFLGSGLRDTYFLDLFSEIIELYGPAPHAHYAFVEPGATDPDFLRQYFGILAWETPHEELPRMLGMLADGIAGMRPRQLTWTFVPAPAGGGASAGRSELRVVRAPLPAVPDSGECLVFSSGGTAKKPRLSAVAKAILDENRLPRDASAFEPFAPAGRPDAPVFVWRHRTDPRFFAVNARLDPWTKAGGQIRPADPRKYPFDAERPTAGGRERRDVRLVSIAVEQLMRAAHEAKYRTVATMLLASGPLRTFPQSHALMQMVRGWARWQERAGDSPPDLRIHVVARDVLYDLGAGRLDLARSLAHDVVEFWLEIEKRDAEPERHLVVAPSGAAVRKVLAAYDVTRPGWTLDLSPHPCLGWQNWRLEGVRRWEQHFGGVALELETFGLLPGSTLRVREPRRRRRNPPPPVGRPPVEADA